MSNARPVPEAAVRDPDSVEMLRVWIAEQQLVCSLKIGMYEEQGIEEARAWGIILSDVIRHVSRALHTRYERDEDKMISEITDRLLSELRSPSSEIHEDPR